MPIGGCPLPIGGCPEARSEREEGQLWLSRLLCTDDAVQHCSQSGYVNCGDS